MITLRLCKTGVAALVLLASSCVFAQVNSAAGTDVTVNATLQESLTVSLDALTVSIPLTAGSAINPGLTAINATTNWSLASGRTAVALYTYFDTPVALVNGAASIANTQFSAKVNGGAALPFTAIVPFGAAYAVQVFNQAITAANRIGVNTSAVTLNIDLSAFPLLPPGTYSGTLHFRAQATP
ncbi:MAG TPA: hypothetical protein VN176_09835 [Verrucomicrobiae bacterium]|jgi:hypothetical protein|nr:hypothetical protein [Verrucomicrobiae bacterium]